MEELNLKKLIAELKEFAESLDEFADNLEKLEEKYANKCEEPDAELLKTDDYDDSVVARHMHAKYADKLVDPDEYLVHSNNGFPHFMEEYTEDDLEESEDEE